MKELHQARQTYGSVRWLSGNGSRYRYFPIGWGTYRVEDPPQLIPAVHTFLDRYHYHWPHLGLSPLRPPLPAPLTQEERLPDIYGE